jgi:hypothetical protein
MEDNAENRLTRDQKKELLLALIETLREPAPTPSQEAPTESRLYRMTPESRAVLDFLDENIDFTDVFICAECFEIRGCWKSHGEVFHQRCRCEESTLSVPDEPWFGFDFNKLVELCYCCGAELVESGFESSVWFCGECKQRVEKLNEAYGRSVIPMGRFDSTDQDNAVTTLKSWMRQIVWDNLRASGFSEADQVPLGTYLEALAERPVDKHSPFDRLCDRFGLKADGRR